MKPRLRYLSGVWWCGPVRRDYFTWAACAPTPREAYSLWERFRSIQTVAAADSAAQP